MGGRHSGTPGEPGPPRPSVGEAGLLVRTLGAPLFYAPPLRRRGGAYSAVPPAFFGMTRKSLETKLAEIRAKPSARDFIIADAKDADMAFGVRAPGPRSYLSARGERPARFSPEVWTRAEYGYRNLPEFLDIIRDIVHQGLVDIMLMSAYVNEQLTIKEGLFRDSHVTPAARANDPTDSWDAHHAC